MIKFTTHFKSILTVFSLFCLLGFSQANAVCVITGPANVCENTTSMYSVSPTGNYTYQWNATGGGTVIGAGSTITVAWGAVGSATVTVIVRDSLFNVVCTGIKNVTINPIPKPVITPSYVTGCDGGKGSQKRDDDCFTACDSTTITYTTPYHAGSTYTWTVGGAANYTTNSNSVTVFWTGIGSGTITVKDSNSFGCVGIKQICIKIVGKPVASFYTLPGLTGLVVNACRLQNIQFVNTSTAGAGSPLATYSWYFGDGGTDFQTAPSNGNTSHAYASSGNYQVMLITENECGCKDTAYINVVVSTDVGPNIYCISTVCPGTVSTYHTNAQCGNWLWSVSGGIMQSSPTDSTCTVQWGNTGPGSITLSVNCPGYCNAPTTVFVPIISNNATISGPSLVCLYDCYTYHISCDIPIDSIRWNFPAGVSVNSDSINVHEVNICFNNPNISGNITATYFHNTNGSTVNLNCGGFAVKPVAVKPKMTITGQTVYCENKVFAFSLSPPSAASIYWTIATPGGAVLTSATMPANTAYSGVCNFGTGNFVVTATNLSGFYCNSPQTYFIKVNPTPLPPDTIIGTLYVCPNNAYTYTAIPTSSNLAIAWQVTNGSPIQGIGNTISVTWGPTGPYSIQAFQIDAVTGCKSAATSIAINSLLPMAPTAITGPTTVCANSTNIAYSTTSIGDDFVWSINSPLAGSIISGNHTNAVNVQWNNYIGTAWLVVKRMVCNTFRKDSILITIGAPPTPVITAPTTVCQGSTMSASSAGAASYAWNFGDGFTGSGSPVPHIYNSPGNFVITLVATYGGSCPGSSTVTKPISVLPKPNVTISTPDPNQFCSAPVSTTMWVAAPAIGTTYVWSPSATTGTSYTATATGTYYVVGTNSYGCKDTSNSISVSIITCTTCSPGPYTLTYNRKRQGCNKDSFIAVTSAGIINLNWNFDDPYNPSTASGTPVTHTFTEPGYYRVKLCADVPDAAGTGYCNVCMFKVDTIKYIPDFFDSTYCTNTSDSVKVKFVNTTKILAGYPAPTYSWLIMPGAYTSTLKSPIKNLAAGTYSVTLTVNGVCTKTKTIVIPALPKAKFTVVDSVCVGKPIVFTNISTGASFSNSWKFGDGATSLIFSPLRTYTLAGNYNVVLSIVNALGCKDTFKKTVTVLPNTLTGAIVAGGPRRFCEGDSVKLTCNASGGYPAYSYLWNTTQTTNVIYAKQTGNFSVDLTDTKGCFYKTPTISVMVKAKPRPKIIGDKKLCQNSQNFFYVNYPNVSGAVIDWIVDGSLYATGSSSIPYYAAVLGNHTIVVNIQSPDTCYGSDTLKIKIFPNPNVSIIASPVLCAGLNNLLVATSTSTNLIGYQWSTGQTNDSIYAGIPKTYSVTAIDSNGCKAQAFTQINPLPDLCGLMIGCYEICDTVTKLVWYAPPGYATYQWSFNGVPIPWATSDTIHLQLYKNGSYTVKITTGAGCTITSEPIDITFVKCGGCKFNASLNIVCGPVSVNGNQTYQLTFNINNSLGAGANINISSSAGPVTAISPPVLAAGMNTVTATFEDTPPVNVLTCFNIVIFNEQKRCDTTICRDLPNCNNKDCKLTTKLKSIKCAGTNGSGNPTYSMCIDVVWGGSNGSTLTLTTASGSFVPNPVTINNGTQTLCYTYTDLPPANSFITLISNVYDPVAGKVCKDSIKFEYKPCTDSCNIGVYGECAHCLEKIKGQWTYDIDLTVYNPFGNNALVTILPIVAGTFSAITPNPVAPGMQTITTVFTDVAPSNNIICFKILLTDVVTEKSCWKDICIALPPCDSNASVLYNIEESFTMVMYPNPTSGTTKLSYQFLHPSNDMQIVITDLNGKLLSTIIPEDFAGETTINTSEWEQGVYFVKIRKDGRDIGTSKLVIVR
ncbi:MAG: PKD domain-containing protein [bacterium]|nr:PKD domain-containing protein [bacterium]